MKKRNLLPYGLLALACLASCGGRVIHYDSNKLQIFVEAYQGGYGTDWIEERARAFEDAHKNDVYGNKIGVEIHVVTGDVIGKNLIQDTQNSNYDIVFSEQTPNYPMLVQQGVLEDLTDIVTEVIPSQGHSIASAMQDDVRSFYETDDHKYYGLPYGDHFYCLVYDEEQFYRKGWFFTKVFDDRVGLGEASYVQEGDLIARSESAKAAKLQDGFYVTEAGETLGKGPDGIYGTHDDGQPETYGDFLLLCNEMIGDNVKPLLWIGNGSDYVGNYLSELATDYEGYDAARVNATFHGQMPLTEDGKKETFTAITMDNYRDVSKSMGRFKALEWLYSIYANGNKNDFVDTAIADNGSAKQMMTHREFLRGTRGQGRNEVAFLLDGAWWEHETEMDAESIGEHANTRSFKMLSNPKADRSRLGPATYVDTGSLTALLLSKTAEAKKAVCKEFLQSCFIDEANRIFSMETGVSRPYSYNLNEADLGNLSSFARNMWQHTRAEGAKIVYPLDDNPNFNAASDLLRPTHYFDAIVDGVEYPSVLQLINADGMTPLEAFHGINAYYDKYI